MIAVYRALCWLLLIVLCAVWWTGAFTWGRWIFEAVT